MSKQKKQYIKAEYLPPRLGIVSTAVFWLLLDRLQPSAIWLGVLWTIWGIFLLLNITSYCIYLFGRESRKPLWEVKE